ncbi:MAG: glycosyltransferase family A protein [Candidatus Methylomirabilales bacterium]
MRFGSNPHTLEAVPPYTPKDVTLAVLVYIPHLTGYFEHKFDILKISIASILKHTDVPYDLLVFDNGSCSEVIQYLLDLRESGVVQYLILSKTNLGVLGAYNVIFSAAPGRYIAYSDDDILFYPGWLREELHILDTFPRVGMVSGLPTWQNFSKYTRSTLEVAGVDPSITVERSKGWPRDWVEDYCESIGWDVEGFISMCKDRDIVKLNRDGVSAFGTSTHCQFVTTKSAVSSILPIDPGGKTIANVAEFDKKLDSAEFMRLSTVRPYVQHMGNTVSMRVRLLVAQYGLNSVLPEVRKPTILSPAVAWLLRRTKVRNLLRRVYGKTFKWMTIAEGKWGESRK